MKGRTRTWWVVLILAWTALAFAAWGTTQAPVHVWQAQMSPGPLSASHARLAENCAACHTPITGADSSKCIGCHAGETALLARQPTAFHAHVGTCTACHIEHRGSTIRPSAMDHEALAEIGVAVLQAGDQNPSSRRTLAWVRAHEDLGGDPLHPLVTPREAGLECVACHGTRDRHQQLFGRDCATCHATGSWAIPAFQHPSPQSVECVQCHRAPPSHFMMHFRMVSQPAARRPEARVDQCFVCHQTTSWNDISGIGWYKHH